MRGGGKSQITCNDIIRNFERGIFCGGKGIAEWKIRSRGLLLARNYEFVQRGGLKPIVKMRKRLNWETCWVKKCNVIQTYYWGGSGGWAHSRRRLWGSGGESSSRWAIFRIFLKIKVVLTPLDHILHVFRAPFESSRFLTFKNQLIKLSCSVLLLLAI